MTTVLDTLQKGTAYLEKYGVSDGRTNMQYLIGHVLDCDRMQLYVDFDRPLDDAHLAELRLLVKRRASGEPLQHILGTVEFCGRDFKTDTRALIPRPETEELVMEVINRLGEEPSADQPLRILDVGCGTGVLGLTFALEIEDSEVTLIDVCPQALSLARENADALEIHVTFVESNLFSNVDGTFDLIVANLPYISDADMQTLSREVQRDPQLALRGGDRGTELIESLISQCPAYLNPGGRVAIEHGYDQAVTLSNAAKNAGFEKIEALKDASKVDRFLFAVKS